MQSREESDAEAEGKQLDLFARERNEQNRGEGRPETGEEQLDSSGRRRQADHQIRKGGEAETEEEQGRNGEETQVEEQRRIGAEAETGARLQNSGAHEELSAERVRTLLQLHLDNCRRGCEDFSPMLRDAAYSWYSNASYSHMISSGLAEYESCSLGDTPCPVGQALEAISTDITLREKLEAGTWTQGTSEKEGGSDVDTKETAHQANHSEGAQKEDPEQVEALKMLEFMSMQKR